MKFGNEFWLILFSGIHKSKIICSVQLQSYPDISTHSIIDQLPHTQGHMLIIWGSLFITSGLCFDLHLREGGGVSSMILTTE